MKPIAVFASAALFAVSILALTGCETTRTNKLHSRFESASDVTTVPHPNPKFASVSTGIPPVPGSPTAASPDGLQPANDGQARSGPGSDEGIPMNPREQPKDKFLHQ